ncbi:hypothetical protein SCHPADRAFT_893756 [Schizopora paradoxa]|uniref:Uncharacterized protein n=1 Tax=Schizopora paradoxa TaxID=27342 RepID=A0A0H2RGD1_9AGAM|nr:hypothetical protein SCHPADRAFT_893756 [Schizopora paradoxa]
MDDDISTVDGLRHDGYREAKGRKLQTGGRFDALAGKPSSSSEGEERVATWHGWGGKFARLHGFKLDERDHHGGNSQKLLATKEEEETENFEDSSIFRFKLALLFSSKLQIVSAVLQLEIPAGWMRNVRKSELKLETRNFSDELHSRLIDPSEDVISNNPTKVSSVVIIQRLGINGRAAQRRCRTSCANIIFDYRATSTPTTFANSPANRQLHSEDTLQKAGEKIYRGRTIAG